MATSTNPALLPPSQSLCGQQPIVSVKEEPLEEDDHNSNRGLVIDLMPRNDPPSSYTKLAEDLSDNNTGGYHTDLSSQGKYLEQTSTRYHPYQRAPREDRDSDRDRDSHCQNNGNIPTHFRAATDASSGFSDEEADDLSRSGQLEQNENMVTGTLHFAISKDCLDDMGTSQSRAKREFVPEFKKDIQYWSKRHKNNISARRSRVKRKTIEKLMEHRMLELQSENMELRRELEKLQTIFGLPVTKTPAPSSSPAESPGSSSSSSGIGNSSTGAPSLHSNSSSPAQCVEEEKGKKAGYQLKVKLANGGQNGNVINKSCEREGGPGYRASNAYSQSASSLSPPAAHFSSAPQPKPSSLSDSGAYPPAAHANSVSRKNSLPASYRPAHRNNAPPAAHSSSSAGSSDNCPASTFAKSYPSYSSPLYSSTHSSFPVYPGAHRSGSGHNYSEFFAKGGSSSSSSSCSSPSATTNGGCSYQAHVRSASTFASSRFAAVPMATSQDYSPPHYMASQSDSSNNTSTSSSSCSYLPNHHHLLARSHHGSAASDASSESSGSSSLRPNSLSDHRDRSSSFSNSPCMSDGSSGASGGSPVLVSEDDASSGSGESRRSSRNSFEEESFHKIPLKCRMKRGLYSPYNKVNVKARKDFV